MRGLILKDFYNLKKYGKQITIILGVFLIFGIMMKSSLYICFMIMLYGTMTIITAMSYDEKAGFDKFALSMPIKREDLVKSKYAVWLIIMFSALLVSFVTGLVINLFVGGNYIEMIISMLAVESVYIILFSIVIPIFFKFGVEKGRMYMMAVFIIPSILGAVAAGVINKAGISINENQINQIIENDMYLIIAGAVIFVILAVYVSFRVSVRIILKKEF